MYQTAFIIVKRSTFSFFLIFSCALLIACQPSKKQHHYSIFAFGTLIDINLFDVDAEVANTAFEQLQKNFDRYHQDWSPWTNGSLAQINKKIAESKPVDIPLHLIPIIKESISLSQQSNHYYNPSIGKLINLWQFHRYQETNIAPPEKNKILALVNQNPNMSDLSISSDNQLTSSNSAVSLNFGAFAKGYAIALEIKNLQALGIENAVINAGGDLSVIGSYIDQHSHRPVNIGIRHPREDTLLASVEVADNESVFTSGDYERVYHHKGKRFHHILDPRTGYPTQDAQSVTVIHSDAGRADAAATAIFVAGSKDWKGIAKNMGIRYVMLIDANNNIHITSAMLARVKLLNKPPTSHIIMSEDL